MSDANKDEGTTLLNESVEERYRSYTDSQIRPHSPYDEILRANHENGIAAPTVQCPTCMGLGKVPRDQENELVALIPVSDHRLKPRRTKCYIILTVLLCMVIAALTLFFLIPRSIEIHGKNGLVVPVFISMNNSIGFIQLWNHYNVTNNNYIPVTVTKLNVQATYDFKQVGESTNQTEVTVPLRSTVLLPILLNLTFDGDQGIYITSYCTNKRPRAHTLLVPFQAIVESRYYGHTEQASLMTYASVRCTSPKPEDDIF